MTETEVHVEHPESTEHHEDLADALAEAQVEAAHTLQQEADVEHAVETAESAIDTAIAQIGHSHDDVYSPIGHTHPELDYSERLALVESRIENIEHGLEEELEHPSVEEITPVEEHTERGTTERRRKHRFGKR